MAKVIEGLYYSESHEYVKVDGDFGYIGITDFAQHALGNVVYVDMPEVDDEVAAEEDFGAVESVKAASDLISPVSGTVVEINEALEDTPELINQDAFENWIIKVELSDKAVRADKVLGMKRKCIFSDDKLMGNGGFDNDDSRCGALSVRPCYRCCGHRVCQAQQQATG